MPRMKLRAIAVALSLGAAGSAALAQSAAFSLSLAAEPTGRWFEYFSDAYGEIGRPFNGSQGPDGYFLISTGAQIGAGFDIFPFEGAFTDVGSLTYDRTGYSGTGPATLPIVGLSADFARYIAPDSTFLGTGYNYTTSFRNVAGTVTVFDGGVAGITLGADVRFTYPDIGFGGDFVSNGRFELTGNRFALFADAPGGIGDPRWRWEFQGDVTNLSPIPEPSSVMMATAGLLLLGAVARRRREVR